MCRQSLTVETVHSQWTIERLEPGTLYEYCLLFLLLKVNLK